MANKKSIGQEIDNFIKNNSLNNDVIIIQVTIGKKGNRKDNKITTIWEFEKAE